MKGRTKQEIHLTRLYYLRDVVVPLVREKQKEGEFALSYFNCGTTKCFLGWAVETPLFQKDGWSWDYGHLANSPTGLDKFPTYQGFKTYLAASLYLGISFEEAQMLFGGPMTFGPFSKRLVRLDRIIARKEKECTVQVSS